MVSSPLLSLIATFCGLPASGRARAGAAASSGVVSNRNTLVQVRHLASPVDRFTSSAATGTRHEGQTIFMRTFTRVEISGGKPGRGRAGDWVGDETSADAPRRSTLRPIDG